MNINELIRLNDRMNTRKKKSKKELIKKLKKEGIKIHRNDISKAKPLKDICGKLKTKHSVSLKELKE